MAAAKPGIGRAGPGEGRRLAAKPDWTDRLDMPSGLLAGAVVPDADGFLGKRPTGVLRLRSMPRGGYRLPEPVRECLMQVCTFLVWVVKKSRLLRGGLLNAKRRDTGRSCGDD